MSQRPANAFLRQISENAFRRLSANLEPADLRLREQVYSKDERPEWVYFPVNSTLSMIATDQSSRIIEADIVGCEGASGLLEALSGSISSVDCRVQIDGQAWRSTAQTCRNLALSDPSFTLDLLKALELQLIASRQSTLCQAKHLLDARFACWLIECFDRSGGRNPLPMNQEFLADMLGVQRTSITSTAGKLQDSNAIHYRRGLIEIIDHRKLETLACDCRDFAVAQRERLGFTINAERIVADTAWSRRARSRDQ